MNSYIRKSSGEVEPFNLMKFQRSLSKAGVPQTEIERLSKEILQLPGIHSTSDIYRFAYHALKKLKKPLAARYNLKNALYELGPEGFAFEKFVAEIFRRQNFTTKLDQIVKGRCVDHEVDVVMERAQEKWVVECKFHNMPGTKSDVKVSLYIKARFDDIEGSSTQEFNNALLITNTQFTQQAIQYGECVGIGLIGWAYPESGNIADLIETLNMHPITSLTTLSTHQKKRLLQRNIFLCSDIHPEHLKEFHFDTNQIRSLQEECYALSLSKRNNPE